MGFDTASIDAQTLVRHLRDVEVEYTHQDAERLKLLKIMKAVHQVATSQANSISPIQSAQICMDSWILATLEIESEYTTLDPNYQPGYFYSTGSSLYSLLRTKIGLKEKEQLSEQRKLISLEQLYNYFFNANQDDESRLQELAKALQQAGSSLNVEGLRCFLLDALKKQLHRDGMSEVVKLFTNALSTETSVAVSTSKLVEGYEHEKNHHHLNPQREKLAQITQAVCAIVEEEVDASQEKDLPVGTLTTAERIRLGAVLHGLMSIDREYYIRSSTNSAYYRLLKSALNGKSPNDFSQEMLDDCLCAYKNFLYDRKVLQKVEAYARDNYLNRNLIKHAHSYTDNIQKEIDVFRFSNPYGTAASIIGTVFAISFMPIGYGAGNVVGQICSATNTTLYLKMYTSDAISNVSKMVFSTAGSWLGFLAADFFVASSMERAFAVVFQTTARYVGLATGTGIGIVVDKSYQGLKNLIEYTLGLESKVDPKLINKEDFEFLHSLLNLPPEVLGVAERAKLEHVITGKHCLFQAQARPEFNKLNMATDECDSVPLLAATSH